jgi:hypothetical protein
MIGRQELGSRMGKNLGRAMHAEIMAATGRLIKLEYRKRIHFIHKAMGNVMFIPRRNMKMSGVRPSRLP